MADLFETIGDNVNPGYLSLRGGKSQAERAAVETLQAMWARYQPYADRGFVEAFARDPEARFWEMFIGCALLDAGKNLQPKAHRPKDRVIPDLCVLSGARRIWIEAIAPTSGESDEDQIPEIVPLNQGGSVQRQPIRQIHLRITSALWTKSQKLASYIREGVIAETDICLVAVGGGRFAPYAKGLHFPLALSAVFPIGDAFIAFDRNALEPVEQGFRPSYFIKRSGCKAIPRTAFLDTQFNHLAGLIWSRVSIGNMSRGQRPISLIHNPLLLNHMWHRWGVWDREFVATEGGDAWTVTDILATSVKQSVPSRDQA